MVWQCDAFGGRRLSDQYFSIALTTNVLDVGAAVLQQISTTAAVTGTATRFTNSGTTANASTAFVRPLIGVNYSSGVAIDVTLRIAYPALEQAAAATTWPPSARCR